ncbi:MAG: tetratricopeptide repeat protein [Planctomycetes bacterium]|nr:tetratricopeptide repeat protein [Planctomycetota bacterium]
MDDNLITPSDYFHRGLEHLEGGKYREALQYFEAAVDRDYFDNDIHLPMGEALFEVGRYQDALDHFNKAEPSDSVVQLEVMLWKGSCFLEMRKPRRAISAFNRVLELHPDHAEAHFKRGLALADMGSPDRALEAFQQAEKLLRQGAQDGDKEALAEVLMWKGRVMTRLGRRQEGLELMFRAYETAPDHPGPYNEIADSFRLSGDLTSAEDWYKKGLERLPDDPSLHNDYGNLLRELGRHRESLQHLTDAIDRDANRSVAYYNRALTLERLELYDEALKDYDTVIDANPGDLDARMRKLDLMAQLGMYKEAHALLLSLTDTERRDPVCQEAASRLYNRQAARAEKDQDVGLALRMHKLALELHPDFMDVESPAPGDDRPEYRLARLTFLLKDIKPKDPMFGLSLLLRGAAEYGLLRLSRAEHVQPPGGAKKPRSGSTKFIAALLESAVVYKAWPELAYKLLAELAFYEMEDEHLALRSVDQAIALRPDFIGALWVKAVILAEGFERPEESTECYRRILQITPNNPTILLALGDLCFDTGQAHRALYYYRRVLEERPGDISVNRDIGHCYLALARYGDAISTFARMDGEGAMGLEIRLDLAEAHLRVGERGEAQSLVDRVVAENEGVDPHVDGRAAEILAALALSRGNPKQALKELKKVHETQLSTYGMVQRIKANIALGKLVDAQDDAQEILDMVHHGAADALETLYQHAKILFQTGHLDDALKSIDELLGHIQDLRAHNLRVWILKLQGKLDESDEAEKLRRFMAELLGVSRLLKHEDYQPALAAAQRLIDSHPDRVEPLYVKACALAQMGDEEQALMVAAEVSRRAPAFKALMAREFYLEPLRLADRPEFKPEAEPAKVDATTEASRQAPPSARLVAEIDATYERTMRAMEEEGTPRPKTRAKRGSKPKKNKE